MLLGRVTVAALLAGAGFGCKGEQSGERPAQPAVEHNEPAAPAPAAKETKAKKKRGWSGQDPFEKPSIAVDGDKVTVTLARREGITLPRGRVPYTAEPYDLAVKARSDELDESDILGLGLALDVNGDGDTGDTLPLSCEDGKVGVGDARFTPLGDAAGEVYTYPETVGRVGDGGAWIVQYSPCKGAFAVVGVSPPDKPVAVERTEGPVLQVVVIEPASRPVLPRPPDLALRKNGAPIDAHVYTTLDYEPIFGPDPEWAAVTWVMLPLDNEDRQTFELTLPHTGSGRLLSARVNLSAWVGKRSRMEPAVEKLPAP